MSWQRSASESHSLRGPIDRTALRAFADEFERMEPLATATLDGVLETTAVRIEFADGIGDATGGRFDIRWSTANDYNIHYTDDRTRDLRWDVHPHEFPIPDGDEHFHPPPNASSDPGDVEGSCILVSETALVARATAKLWRAAYDRQSVNELNEVTNPP